MKCLTCENDVTEQDKQYGDLRHPICLSCWLAGMEWVQSDNEIIFEIEHGVSVSEAIETVNKKRTDEIQEEFQQWFFEIMTLCEKG